MSEDGLSKQEPTPTNQAAAPKKTKHPPFTKDSPTAFSTKNQPDPAKIKAGVKRARVKRELLQTLLGMHFTFPQRSAAKKQLVAAFGEEVLDMNIAELMVLQQAKKAVMKGDTYAFQAVLNQTLGMPRQEITGGGGAPLVPPKMVVQSVSSIVPILEDEIEDSAAPPQQPATEE